jgi:hypothetical protein
MLRAANDAFIITKNLLGINAMQFKFNRQLETFYSRLFQGVQHRDIFNLYLVKMSF